MIVVKSKQGRAKGIWRWIISIKIKYIYIYYVIMWSCDCWLMSVVLKERLFEPFLKHNHEPSLHTNAHVKIYIG